MGESVQVVYTGSNTNVGDIFYQVFRQVISQRQVFDTHIASIFNKAPAEKVVPPVLFLNFWPRSIAVIFPWHPGAGIHRRQHILVSYVAAKKVSSKVNYIVAYRTAYKYAQLPVLIGEVVGETKSIFRIYI